ncbi:exonuclease domain-containing protein [Flavobacterium artemisiae]|uniref:Exonuclease domain-containing protein n=1 Tax=Flavobacterium artemisiae TaxID=2126556 RepID=A0ABW4HBE9_9FLAO
MVLYDKIIVIDIEATCWETTEETLLNQREIIEIGVCKLILSSGKIENKQSFYIKPEVSQVSSFCTQLTGITNEKLQIEGTSLEKALKKINSKYSVKYRTFAGYGDFDQEILEQECKAKAIENPFRNDYLNIKTLFNLAYLQEKPQGLLKELELVGESFEGKNHNGADDAYNAAKLLYKVLQR